MRLSVAANFDHQLPARLAEYPVSELYGKLPRDAVGGGRASYMLAPTSRRRLEEHVREARRHGIAFNYLLNPACMGNREFSLAGQRDLRRLLDWVSEIGVEWVTVSLPFLLEVVKSRYPHLRTRVGVYAQVNSPERARFWEDLGADCISVDPLTCNRDFDRLRAMRQAVTCDLQLLANSTCLRECPLSPYHMVCLSHASRGGFSIDYCLLACSILKLSDPANFVKSPWIRPNDLPVYEQMGYTSIKILERDAPTDALVARTRAYAERRFEGNLIHLIQPYGYREERSDTQPKRHRLWDLATFFRPWKADTARLLKLREFARLRGMIYRADRADDPVVIDNRALDGFLEGIIERGCRGCDCSECGYCAETARRAVWIDPDYRDACLRIARSLIADLASGAMWFRREMRTP